MEVLLGEVCHSGRFVLQCGTACFVRIIVGRLEALEILAITGPCEHRFPIAKREGEVVGKVDVYAGVSGRVSADETVDVNASSGTVPEGIGKMIRERFRAVPHGRARRVQAEVGNAPFVVGHCLVGPLGVFVE